MRSITATVAPFSPRITSRRPLYYRRGADPTLDRPGHVRAASGLCWVGAHLAVVQDDARFVGTIHFAGSDTLVDDIPLPPGPGGRRVFDDGIGNKRDKPDLEVAFAVDGELWALGSGGRYPARQGMVRWRPGESPVWSPEVALFERLADHAGRPLNLEGGALVPDGRVVLAHRGGHGGTAPDVLLELSFAALSGQEPFVVHTTRVVLGDELHFTDLAPASHGLWYSAVVEATQHFAKDGPVHSAVIGRLRPSLDGWAVEHARVLEESGRPSVDKIEGLAAHPRGTGWLLAVTDPDDPDRPGELLEIALDVS